MYVCIYIIKCNHVYPLIFLLTCPYTTTQHVLLLMLCHCCFYFLNYFNFLLILCEFCIIHPNPTYISGPPNLPSMLVTSSP